MAGLDPHKGMDAIDELGLMVETHGFRGAAIDPFLAKIPPTTQNIIRSVPSAVNSTFRRDQYGHGDPGGRGRPRALPPRYIDAVARDFPKLKIVVSHGCYPWVNEIIMVVQRNRNVYLELSGTSSRRSPKATFRPRTP